MKKFILTMFISFFPIIFIFPQSKISGKVTGNDTKRPIAYVSVLVKGYANVGANTADNGEFSINLPFGAKELVFSSIGYKTQTVLIGSRSIINIELEPETTQLDESIAIAYGVVKKGTYTGSAGVVKGDNIKDSPVTSFENALSGKIAGMQVSSGSGQAGSATNVRIRGTGSMNASNEPLYVIDGIPAISGDISQMGGYIYTSSSAMSLINPSDIESITVLKDAAAASLYGSRAANGVIIITTKKGKLGKPKINFKSSVGITPSFATNNWDNASPHQQMEMYYELFWNGYVKDGKTPEYANEKALAEMNKRFNKHGYQFSAPDNTVKSLTVSAMTDGVENREGKYYNWENALFRTGVYQTYDLAVSGGNENTTAYSSIGYTKDKGRAITNEYNRISGRLNLNQKVGKYMEFATNVNITNSKRTGFNDSRSIRDNYFMLTRNMLWPMYWTTDYKTGEDWTARYGSAAYNPIYYNKKWSNSSKTTKISASETFSVKIMPDLILKSIFSYDKTMVKDHIYWSAEHYAGVSDNGRIIEMRTDICKWVSSTTLNYNKTFADIHKISVLAGFEAEKNNTDFLFGEGTNLPTSQLHTISTAGTSRSNGYDWGNSMASVFSRLEYNYNDKYFVSGSIRRDGSSKLAPDVRWNNFWSIAGAWKINKEPFMKNFQFINNLKLRASYGINAILPPSDYGWRSLVSYRNKYNGEPGGSLANIADKNLTWEKNYNKSVALEFGFFQNRISGTVEYFNRNTKDLLQWVPISRVTGFSSTLKNVGEMNNKGFEIELNGDIIRKEDLKISANVTASFIKTKITKLYGGQDIIWYDPTGDDDRVQYIYIAKDIRILHCSDTSGQELTKKTEKMCGTQTTIRLQCNLTDETHHTNILMPTKLYLPT